MSDNPSNTRTRLIVAMTESLRRRGYNGTSVKDVTVAATSTIGSMYHHFPEGKPALTRSALHDAGAAYMELLPALLDQHEDLSTTVQLTFEAAAQQMEAAGWLNLCPVGTVAGEVADTEPELRAAIADIIEGWFERGAEYFVGRGLPPETAREFTLAALSALEGAFILSRTVRSTAPVLAAGRAMSAFAAEITSDSASIRLR
ncbi:TetR/AcrR family transcriptional regulator [Nocardiopsis tropica]|uniref:TetR/AcrR family transcriptional regulator n=1 Tax=Tsukamurella TaxID=2060 RepID=UPI00207E1FF2|nr:TetR/AcrR family transcriptional regulator [Tsukamurella sp. TY48]GIZ97463.1 putative transcriptional regulator, TetR family protein [Tsukamurella sp. TY48]